MKTPLFTLSILLCLLLLWTVSCKKDPDPTPGGSTTKSTAKAITTFAFNGLNPPVTATIDATTKTISATVTSGTDITKLMPTITLSDKATVSPGSGTAQDFSKAVTYTVTAEDGTMQAYIATVTVDRPNNGTVYVGNLDGVLVAVDALTGEKKWTFTAGGPIQATPTVANGLVYIASWDKKLYALDAATGVKKWEFAGAGMNQPYGAVMVADGLVYVNSSNILFALDATNGAKKWEFLGDDSYTFQASPTVVNDVVYASLRGTAASRQGVGTFALNAKTGTKIWSAPTNVWTTESSPAVVNNLLYAGAESDGAFSAFDATTGSMKWKYTVASVATSSPTVANGVVYIGSGVFGTNNKKLYALNATTGIKKWEYAIEESTAGFSSPIVASGIVYIGSGSTLYAVDAANGTKKWDVKPEANTLIYSGPVVATGYVYLGIGKKLYAFDASTGAKKWEYDTGRTIDSSSPCVLAKDGTVYYAGISGMVQ